MEYQKITNLLDNTSNQATKFRRKNWIEINDDAQAGENPINVNEEVVSKNCAPFTDCISEINNTQTDNAEDIDVVMPMYNLIEYSDNYLRWSGFLWHYYRDEPALTDVDPTANFYYWHSARLNLNKKTE